MKLHIGPGDVYMPGWVNIDLFSSVKSDMYASALAIPYPAETFDIIYASHVLEHINRNMVLAALTHWRSLLKVGGILRLAVPNFNAICTYYESHKDLEAVLGLLYGGQQRIMDEHKTVFDFSTLTHHLELVGFETIRIWDWEKTEHSNFDDYSQAYLPHMHKKDGMLMSLNVEAIK